MLQYQSLIYFSLLLFEMVSSRYYDYVILASRTTAPEENCSPPTLILTPTLNQTLTLTMGQFSSGEIVRTPYFRSIQKNISNWYDIKKAVELHCKPIDMVSTW